MSRKITSIMQRLGAFALAMAMVFSMLLTGMTAEAAEAASTINYEEKGSLTIYKYKDSETLLEKGEYATQEELEKLIEDNEDKLTPMDNVIFTYLNVGDIVQSSVDSSTSQVTIGYSINDSELVSLLDPNSNILDVAFTEGETKYYTTESLQEALDGLTQTQAYNYITTKGGTAMPATVSGVSTVNNLDVGLYLIVETGYPADVTVTTEPFFVSIPMTDSTTEGDETTYSWIYDVTCYPKNSTSELTIDKSVVEDGNESKNIDGEIGDQKQFVIRADVPSTIGNLSSYVITDTLTDGLTYDSSSAPVVRGLKSDGTYDTLTSGTEYDFNPPTGSKGGTLTFDFEPSELVIDQSINSEYAMIEITYYAYLNEDAVVGDDGNTNGVRLDYESTSGATGTVEPTIDPAIYTYAIDLQKLFNGATTGEFDFSNVTFELYRDNSQNPGFDNAEGPLQVTEVTADTAGAYYVTGKTGTGITTLTVDTTGKLSLKGLEAGTYYLVETGTDDGYNLLADPIEIVITSNEGTYSENLDGTFIQIDNTYEYALDNQGSVRFVLPADIKNGAYVNFGTNQVWCSDDNGSSWTEVDKTYKPNDLTWSATVGGSDASMDEDGVIDISVNNTSGFQLPATGGMGTTLFMVVGGILIIAAVALLYKTSRKKNGTDAGTAE